MPLINVKLRITAAAIQATIAAADDHVQRR